MNALFSSVFNRDNFAGATVVGLAFLIPILVVPLAAVPFQFTKTIIALIGAVILIGAFVIGVLRSKTISVPYAPLVISLGLLPVAYFVSAVFSSHQASSFFGYLFEGDTFGFILAGTVMAFGVFLSIKNQKTIFSSLFWFLISGWVILIFQLFQTVVAPLAGFTVFASPVTNLIGRWNDFGLFIGLLVSLVLVIFVSVPLSKIQKNILFLTLALSIFFLVLVNFTLVWSLVGFVAFLLFVFSLTRSQLIPQRDPETDSGAFIGSMPSGIVLTVAIVFLIFGNSLSSPFQNIFGLQTFEVRPSFAGTQTILEAVYQENPVFGTGPNTFQNEWFLHRPAEIVATPFWNVPFVAGFGFIPTAFVTGGLLVGLFWIILILSFFYTVYRALIGQGEQKGASSFLIATAGVGTLFLIIAHLFYVPSTSLTLVMFLFLGLFLASLKGTSALHTRDITFTQNRSLGFASVFLVIILMMGTLALLFFAGRLFLSALFYEQAVSAFSQGDIPRAETKAQRSLSFAVTDRAYRILSLSSLSRLSSIVATGATDSASQDQFRSTLTNAITSARQALAYNSNSFENWMAEGAVYGAIVPTGIDGAYDNAIAVYGEARKRNPMTPEVDYRIAQIEAANGKRDAARTSAEASIALKADYTPAILFLGQLALDEGNLNQAIRSVESALVFEPQNTLILYQLGVLRLSNSEYTLAADSFEKALAINPNYANAQFFLAEAYTFLKKPTEALSLLENLIVSNPNDQNLPALVGALKKGENPFVQNVPPPQDPTVEE